jgi:hypothetical protein
VAPGQLSSALLPNSIGNSAPPVATRAARMDNGDVAIIGTELTSAYAGRLPAGAGIAPGEPRRHPAQHDCVREGGYPSGVDSDHGQSPPVHGQRKGS